MKTYLPVIILLSLFWFLLSDECLHYSSPALSFTAPNTQNLFCYVNSFNPEQPEISRNYQNDIVTVSSSAVTASGTTTTTTLPYFEGSR